ncbi:MAG TPA: nitroreductase/quinone reductase family protein [Candidatus Binatia bacterium]|nr:nitroreductase/quinone reductase family protein [Candidatus Binatia bacterium]
MSRRLVEWSTRLNPLVSAILRSRVHWLLSPGLMLITVTGRKSGRRYTIPVGYLQTADAIIILISEAPSKMWWRNYRDEGPIEVLLRGRRRGGRALLVQPTSPEFRARADAGFRRSRFIARIFGIDFDPRGGLSNAQVEQLARRAAIVRVTLDP